MKTIKEYLLLSAISYSDFSMKDCGKTLYDIFNNSSQVEINGFSFAKKQNSKEIIKKYFDNFFKEWMLFYVEDKRAKTVEKDATGFFGVVFKNIEKNRYIIAFRGSERYPLEDAYKDFIENDLKIGLGIKPLQFYDGVALYNKILDDFKIDKNLISLTGHSLGGGIAQFVAIVSDRERKYVPYTYTWNSIGINREGIINIFDFFDYNEILNGLNLNENEKRYFLDFRDEYLVFFFKEMKRKRIMKDNNTLLVNSTEFPETIVDDELIKNFFETTSFEERLRKLPLSTQNRLMHENNIFNVFFKIENVKKEVMRTSKFIEKIKNNLEYETRIINFCHSEDLTVSLFPHIGAVYQVEKEFFKSEIKKKTIFSSLLFFTKSVQNYHNHDVFIPFLINTGVHSGLFDKTISNTYLSSLIRKIFTFEYCVEKELLADYYSFIEITDDNFEKIKNQIIDALKKCEANILYKTQGIKRLEQIEKEGFKEVWKSVIKKLSSPYKPQDIHDLILF